MPRHPKRPRDMMQLAKLVGEIAVGEQDGDGEVTPNEERASKGGRARAEKISANRRKAIAKKAATARWKDR